MGIYVCIIKKRKPKKKKYISILKEKCIAVYKRHTHISFMEMHLSHIITVPSKMILWFFSCFSISIFDIFLNLQSDRGK